MDHAHIDSLKAEYEKLSADGFRVLAIAGKDIAPRGIVAGDATPYSQGDEADLILHGYVAFLDPPKETAGAAIRSLQARGVQVKVLTGDNELVARKICKEVGLPTEHVLLGADIEAMDDGHLADAVTTVSLFARVSPSHKQRIIKALQSRDHTVGFMGDGINDAAAKRAADVGISVDTAVDIAKASARVRRCSTTQPFLSCSSCSTAGTRARPRPRSTVPACFRRAGSWRACSRRR